MAAPFPLILALRYLRSARRDAFTSFLSAVAGGGIALGVAALILALAALSGLQGALREEILARTAEIEIELPAGADAAAIADRLQRGHGETQLQRLARGRGWLLAGGRVQPVELIGYEGELPANFPGAMQREPGLYISDSLALRLGVEKGEILEIASPRPTLTPFGPQPRLRGLPLAGTYVAGRTEEEARVAAPLEWAASLLGRGPQILQLTTGSLDRALTLAPQLSPLLPAGAVVRTWRELNRPLFFALRLEKVVLFVGVALIVAVAALALVADLALILANKRREVGMLGAMGATPGLLRSGFLTLGGLLAAGGVAVGLGVGMPAAWLLDRFRLIALPGNVYFIDYLPFSVRAEDVIAVVSATLALALAAAFYAAQRAATVEPVETLRR